MAIWLTSTELLAERQDVNTDMSFPLILRSPELRVTGSLGKPAPNSGHLPLLGRSGRWVTWVHSEYRKQWGGWGRKDSDLLGGVAGAQASGLEEAA